MSLRKDVSLECTRPLMRSAGFIFRVTPTSVISPGWRTRTVKPLLQMARQFCCRQMKESTFAALMLPRPCAWVTALLWPLHQKESTFYHSYRILRRSWFFCRPDLVMRGPFPEVRSKYMTQRERNGFPTFTKSCLLQERRGTI